MASRELIKVVNQMFDLRTLLESMGCSVYQVPMTLRCPFHDDSSKSAKIFEDNRLYCWTCHKQYGSWDALQELGVSEAEIKRQLSQMGAVTIEEDKKFEVDEESAKGLRAAYRLGKVKLRRYLDGVYMLAGK